MASNLGQNWGVMFLYCLLLLFTFLSATATQDQNSQDNTDQAELVRRSREHIERILLGGGIHPEQQKDDQNDDDDIKTPIKIDQLPDEHLKALHTLRDIYQKKIRPVENQFHYEDLKRHQYTDADIFAKPIVLLVGPWSTGKSTIINYILGTEDTLEELYVGAEPTTSDFTVLSHGETYKTVEGIVLASDASKPFSPMEKFGQVFLEHLLGIEMPRSILQNVTFIDTPGILENRRQQERGYPYNDVLRWLVARSDLIFVVFDPTKLDVGTELEALFKQLKGHESVVRIVLNKADSMAEQDLMRVYGTLFWSLAPLINVTEPPRIYVGSFWSQPYGTPELEELLTREEKSLLKDMRDVMRNQVQNKIASIRQHAIRVRIHALLVDSYLAAFRKNKAMFSAGEELAETIADEPDKYNVFKAILNHPNVSKFDLPDPEEYKDFFRLNTMYDLKRISDHCSSWSGGCSIDKLNQAIAYDLPALLNEVLKPTKKKSTKDGHCDKKDKSCKEDKARAKKYKTDGAKVKDTKADRPVETKKSKNDKGRLRDQQQQETKSEKAKKQHKLLAEASPNNQIDHSDENSDDDDVSEEVDSDDDASNEEEDDVEDQSFTKQTRKLKCLYRKSCYQTGKKPDLTDIRQAQVISKPVPITNSVKEISEEDRVRATKFACKYRPSCYDDGFIMKKEKVKIEHSKKPAKEAETHKKHRKEEVKIEEDTETGIRGLKFKCRYRKSCYETGIVPDREEMARVQAKKVSHTPASTKVLDEQLDKEINLRKMKHFCQYRKSCYETKERKDLAKERETHAKKEKQSSTENTQKSQLEEDAKAQNLKCKYKKSCGSNNEPLDEPRETIKPAEKRAQSSDKSTKERLQSQTVKSDKKSKQSRQEKDDDDKDDDHKEKDKHKKKTKKHDQEMKSQKKENQNEDISDEEKSGREKRSACKYRKDCYQTGKIPSKEDLAKAYTRPISPPTKNKESKKQDDDDEVDLKEIREKRRMKHFCQYRKSCYESGKRKDLQKEMKENSLKYEEIAKSKAKFEEVNLAEISVREKKFACKYRKDCYETGIIPDLAKQQQYSKEKASTKEKIKHKEDIIDVRQLPVNDKKFRCKYRKDCYETGKVPDLSTQTQNLESNIKKTIEDHQIEDEEISERHKKFLCRYRKNCYKTGIILSPQHLAREKGTIKEIVKTVIPTELSEEDKKRKRNFMCKYKKSCYATYEQGNENSRNEKDQKSRSKQEDKIAAPKIVNTENTKKHRENKPVAHKKKEEKSSESEEDDHDSEGESTPKPRDEGSAEDEDHSAEVHKPKRTADSDEEEDDHIDFNNDRYARPPTAISDEEDDVDNPSDDHSIENNEEVVETEAVVEEESAEKVSQEPEAEEEAEARDEDTVENDDDKEIEDESVSSEQDSKETSDVHGTKSSKKSPVQHKEDTKRCNKWKKYCPTHREAESQDDKPQIKDEKAAKPPCNKWRKNCPEYEDPKLPRQKDAIKTEKIKEKIIKNSANFMPKKCNKWHKNCPEYAAWKTRKTEESSDAKSTNDAPDQRKKAPEKAECKKGSKNCRSSDDSDQQTKHFHDRADNKQTDKSSKKVEHSRKDGDSDDETDTPRQHKSAWRPPDSEIQSSTTSHSKCSPYRKSCNAHTDSVSDTVSTGESHESVPCKKYRKSCNGGQTGVTSNTNANSKKKLCRKQKQG